jgi:hypothetical protein
MKVIQAIQLVTSIVLVALAVVVWLTIVPLADALRRDDAPEDRAPRGRRGPRVFEPVVPVGL